MTVVCNLQCSVCINITGELISEDKILQVMPNVTLAMHLLIEFKVADSFWKPYLGKLF